MGNLSEEDLDLLHRSVELAITALRAGERPEGALLVDEHGEIRFEVRSHGGRSPEVQLADWAGVHLSPGQRCRCTVYTTTEFSGAWPGRVIHASSRARVAAWYRDWGAHPGPGVFDEILRDLHHWHHLALVDASAHAPARRAGLQTPPGKPS